MQLAEAAQGLKLQVAQSLAEEASESLDVVSEAASEALDKLEGSDTA